MIKKYRAEIVSTTSVIEGVHTLEIRSLDKPFKYAPGQFLHLAIDAYDPSGQWPESRCFSMQSSPDEELIKITYAVKGRFTRRMQQEMKPGSQVTLKLPYGDLFTQPHNRTKTVFIAGGTGITPFLSLFTHESFIEYHNPSIYLGFRSKHYNIYEHELNIAKLSTSSGGAGDLHIYYQDEDGQIDIKSILAATGINSDYFISGPPSMIKAFKKYLIDHGVSHTQIKTDDWE
jgi:ferredoxin-NADP reductase